MTRIPVKSSNIVSVGYDEKNLVLEVEFKQGEVYRFMGVTVDKHNALMEAESPGKYFYKEIKGKHDTQKVDTEVSAKKEKPDCYKCKHRGTVPGDTHSCCQYPGNKICSIYLIIRKT